MRDRHVQEDVDSSFSPRFALVRRSTDWWLCFVGLCKWTYTRVFLLVHLQPVRRSKRSSRVLYERALPGGDEAWLANAGGRGTRGSGAPAGAVVFGHLATPVIAVLSVGGSSFAPLLGHR